MKVLYEVHNSLVITHHIEATSPDPDILTKETHKTIIYSLYFVYLLRICLYEHDVLCFFQSQNSMNEMIYNN